MRQTFVLTLEVPEDVASFFPEIEAFRMADIVRDGFVAKSCSFMGPVPFTVKCQQVGAGASSQGKMKAYSPEDIVEGEYRAALQLQAAPL